MHADFHLRHPRVWRDGDALVAAMDVTASGPRQLAGGDGALCLAFAAALGWEVTGVRDWAVRRFCALYYSSYPSSPDWVNRVQVAWRLTFRGHGPQRPAYLGPGPFRATGVDTTAQQTENFWVPWAEEDCLAIGDEVVGGAEDRAGPDLSEVGAEEAVVEVFPVDGGVVRQHRLSLGRLALPGDLDRLVAAESACARAGLIVSPRETDVRIVDLHYHTQR